MFNSGIKANQRCNGIYPPQGLSVVGKVANNSKHYNNSTYKLINSKIDKNVHHSGKKTVSRTSHFVQNQVKIFNGGHLTKLQQGFEEKIAINSIIGFNEYPSTQKPSVKFEIDEKPKRKTKATHHETLQRIEGETDEFNHYQQSWFSSSLEKLKLEDRSREERIEITRHDFLRRLQQLNRSNVGRPNKMPDWVERRKEKVLTRRNKLPNGTVNSFVPVKFCEAHDCGKPALACAKYCVMHIMYDNKQVLFEYCTAKFADNTQCSVPVFDISHELPLCAEHARKRDNYRLYQEAKPKRKRMKPSAMIRPQKRSKKKRKPPSSKCETITSSSAINRETNVTNEIVREIEPSPVLEEDLHIVDQVLALNENGLEQALVSQAHLLEETDISNVLSTIQVDEFSDFFTVNRNGEYEPSREEAEELEKALAAVDNDVKSLEKLSQTHGLLDSFLDDHVLPDSLVQIPEMMFHNGYPACGDNIVAQSSSFLLPVEPHSNS
ncbi:uncharacterized protein LOC126742888 isoform X2 [Anthonomus grandis grandis]|uniref:uncharacterized protein LOC126742888 isoform X2 n=1 Tax=Anthonomus grandis grandis TaxID=2921223 RepID=UPI00216634F8|nr:uncharacterized protein LOC126742888 isoform X2 [Anthonomus grandis grandis]